MPTVFGVLRVRNEVMWIRRVLYAMLPVCERIFLLDDHSTDCTPEVARDVSEKVTVYHSPFEGLDESRDKGWLLDRINGFISEDYLNGDPRSPYWVLALDGDEELQVGGADIIRQTIADTDKHCFSVQIKYFWDGTNRVRVDGVYRNFCRPSLFRLMNRNFKFLKTPFGNGANFHCSSVPQELLAGFGHAPVKVWHYGYMIQDHRRRKYDWYNTIDPNNGHEDFYQHIIQGDPEGPNPGFKLKHAGPLEFEDTDADYAQELHG